MKIGIIGDIVGRCGREAVREHLRGIKEECEIDFVVANAENASGGFGLNINNANELFSYGVDVITLGNHSFDKPEIASLMENRPILRPLNYPQAAPGRGIFIKDNVAFINVMGHYGININVDNVFCALERSVDSLLSQGMNIIIDFHAEASSEKRMAFCMLRGKIAALFGTHTHTGSDDLHIQNGSFYVSDVGLCGAFDGVIGMDSKAPLFKALHGYGQGRFEVARSKYNIFQMIVLHIENNACKSACKLRYINSTRLSDIHAISLDSMNV